MLSCSFPEIWRYFFGRHPRVGDASAQFSLAGMQSGYQDQRGYPQCQDCFVGQELLDAD